MKYVYMNHRIREAKPKEPVIVVQDETLTIEANRFEILVDDQLIGFVEFDQKGLDACDTHNVRAWVEFNNRVLLRPIGRAVINVRPIEPVAEPKKPNRKVKIKK